MPTFEENLRLISAVVRHRKNKFGAKLDFDQRCEVLALHMAGVGRNELAEMYGIDRRTVTHMYSEKSVHYRSVRDERDRLGAIEFMQKYITENALVKIKNMTPRAEDVLSSVKGQKNANRFAGVHTIHTELCTKPHRIFIAWKENGWYYQDIDGADPTAWLHNGDDSRVTSKACFDAVTENLVDL